MLQVLEQIMFKYVDLCIELKKGRHAKDGLIHYRNICQQVNVQSLEEVIKYYLKTTTDRAEEAQGKAKVGAACHKQGHRNFCTAPGPGCDAAKGQGLHSSCGVSLPACQAQMHRCRISFLRAHC